MCLIAGLALLTLSTGAGSDTAVRCDGTLMQPGDICEYTNRSGEVTSQESYDEVEKETKAAHHTFVTWGRWAMLGGGAVLTVLAIWGIAARRRRAKNQGPTTADLYFQQQAAQQQPQPHPAPQPYPQAPAQQYPPQPYPPQQTFPPRSPQPHAAGPVAAPASNQDFGPGSGDDVTQRLR